MITEVDVCSNKLHKIDDMNTKEKITIGRFIRLKHKTIVLLFVLCGIKGSAFSEDEKTTQCFCWWSILLRN